MESPAHVLATNVKKARQFALSCDYKSALVYYEGLDREIDTHATDLEVRGDASAAKWRKLRVTLGNEHASVQAIVQELEALAYPAVAAKLDRQYASGEVAAAPARRGAAQPAEASPQAPAAVRPPYRTDDDVPDLATHDEWAAGAAPRPARQQQQPARVEQPRPARVAPARNAGGGGRGGARGAPSVGDVNARLYGDPDRFAPPDDAPGASPAMGFGVPPPVPRRKEAPAPSGGAGGAGRARSVPSGGANGGAAGKAGGADAGGGKARKPAVPRFGKKDGGADGGGGAATGPDGKKRAPFQPRPGDEELAQAIASEMTDPSSIGVTFDQIAGQKEAKDALEEAVVYPAMMPEYYTGILSPPKGVLLYGPPGTGKSMLAKAVASMGQTTFFNVSPATLTSKLRGDSEKLVRVMFEMARHYSPSIIFIDEVDSLAGQRGNDQHEASRRTLSVLLAMMDGVGVDQSQYVMVLGATNHPWDIDEAMRRRFEKRIHIPLPGHEERVALFRMLTSQQGITLADDVNFERLSSDVARLHYNGSDIATLVRESLQMPMRRYVQEHRDEMRKDPQAFAAKVKELAVTMADFVQAVSRCPSSINAEVLDRFEDWKKQFEF